MARKYELKSRAARQEETRQRIVEAAVELHQELGPGRTSISAIAERAGVERLTVYRHFATERDIFQACSARFDELHPLPNIALWETIDDPFERFACGLSELYRYFADTERMTQAAIRDAPSTPSMLETFARYQQRFHMMFATLVAGFVATGIAEESVGPPIRLAIDFRAWQIMVRELGMGPDDAVAYQLRIVRCAADRS